MRDSYWFFGGGLALIIGSMWYISAGPGKNGPPQATRGHAGVLIGVLFTLGGLVGLSGRMVMRLILGS